MPVFKNYDEEGKLIGTTLEPLSENNLGRFIALYGEEKAKIYFEAFTEFTEELKNIVYTIEKGNYFANSLCKVRRKATDLYKHNSSVVKAGEKLIVLEPSENAANSSTSLQP